MNNKDKNLQAMRRAQQRFLKHLYKQIGKDLEIVRRDVPDRWDETELRTLLAALALDWIATLSRQEQKKAMERVNIYLKMFYR